VSIDLLVWAPPVLGPLTFSLVGLVGISAAWLEEEPDSGVLVVSSRIKLRLPYSKTRAYFFMVAFGILATLISSVLDHARTPFQNPWLWIPVCFGIFGALSAFLLGALNRLSKADLWTYFVAMLGLILVGVVGLGLHFYEGLTADREIVIERFLRGAPILAPMLFADMGAFGLIAMLGPEEVGSRLQEQDGELSPLAI
jgi:hypothetical protein